MLNRLIAHHGCTAALIKCEQHFVKLSAALTGWKDFKLLRFYHYEWEKN